MRPSSERRWHKMIAVLGVVSVLGTTPHATDRAVRIYVFTQPSQFVDEESKRRNDSVNDLEEALGKQFVVVAKREDADLLIEVTNSRMEIHGLTTIIDPHGNPTAGIGSEYAGDATVRAVLRIGTYSTEMVGRYPKALGAWHKAASQISDQVAKWVKYNRAQILK